MPTICNGLTRPTEQPGSVNFGAVMVWLRENLPADAILCNGAGNYAAWIYRFFRFRRFAHHVAPASGSMGYGVPAAVAMKRLYPRAAGRVPCRRRRFSDERPGIRYRRTIRSAVRHHHRRQRHVRHHPHASGARISRPHFGDANCAIRTLPLTHAPSAASASRSRAPRIFPRRSRRRKHRASPPSCGSPSMAKRSRRR